MIHGLCGSVRGFRFFSLSIYPLSSYLVFGRREVKNRVRGRGSKNPHAGSHRLPKGGQRLVPEEICRRRGDSQRSGLVSGSTVEVYQYPWGTPIYGGDRGDGALSAEESRHQTDRALDSLQKELNTLLGLSQDLTLRVRASQEVAARLKRLSEEFKNINVGED